MKSITLGLSAIFFLSLSACSELPKECEESWSNIEKLAKESGIPQEAINNQKKEFEKQIEAMSKDSAIEACKAQNSIFGDRD